MEHTICAVATAIGQGGIGIVRMSGKTALSIGREAFRSKYKKEEIHRLMEYGHILSDEGDIIDEVLYCPMYGPDTYTTEDMVEIYTHGGVLAVRKVYERLLQLGALPAEAGEFTKRAFLNGRIDLSQAEAVQEIVSAKNEEAYKQSHRQLEGKLAKRIQPLFDQVLNMMAAVEASISFSEDTDDVPSLESPLHRALEETDHLLATAHQGKMMKEGVATLITGKPNVGKSSLFNALMQENRALVTDIPGTTRDTIEEVLQLQGIALRMIDTAGIRETADIVERLGVEKAKEELEKADLVLWVVDASNPMDEEDEKIKALIGEKPAIAVINKQDIATEEEIDQLQKSLTIPSVIISAKENTGVDSLTKEIQEMFAVAPLQGSDQIFLTNSRHVQALQEAKKALLQAKDAIAMGMPLECTEVDLHKAYTALGEITGQTVQEDILDRVFSNFCIGK